MCEHMAVRMCRDEKTSCRSRFSPSTLWVPGIKFKSGLAANTFAQLAIRLSPDLFIYLEYSV